MREAQRKFGAIAPPSVSERERQNQAHFFFHKVKNQMQRRRKGIHVTRVAMLLMQDMRLTSMDQLSSEPWSLEGRETIGPTPLALTIHHTKKVIPAMGVIMAFKVNK